MKHKQPNYFGLTSSIARSATGLQWFADRSATGLQLVCIGLQLIADQSAGLQICVEHDRQNNVRNRHIYSHRVSSCPLLSS